MPMFKKLAALVGAAEAARRYARKNPAKASKLVDQAAEFVDKQTKGKYKGQIDGAVRKAKGAAGIPASPGYGAGGNGYTQGYNRNAGPGQPGSGGPSAGQPYPGGHRGSSGT